MPDRESKRFGWLARSESVGPARLSDRARACGRLVGTGSGGRAGVRAAGGTVGGRSGAKLSDLDGPRLRFGAKRFCSLRLRRLEPWTVTPGEPHQPEARRATPLTDHFGISGQLGGALVVLGALRVGPCSGRRDVATRTASRADLDRGRRLSSTWVTAHRGETHSAGVAGSHLSTTTVTTGGGSTSETVGNAGDRQVAGRWREVRGNDGARSSVGSRAQRDAEDALGPFGFATARVG